MFDRKRAKLVGHAVPAKELTKVDVAHFQCLDIFENVERNRRVKGKLFIALDEASTPIRGQPKAWDLGEGGIQIFHVSLQGRLLTLRPGGGYASTDAEACPQGRHARHDAPNARDGVY